MDVCVLLPRHARDAHCRDKAARARLGALLDEAAGVLRACEGVSGVQVVREGRTPLIRFEFDEPIVGAGGVAGGAAVGGGRCTSVELCINNTDGLADTVVLRELMRSPMPPLMGSPLRALAAVARRWAKRRGLCGGPTTLNAYTWTLLATFALQQMGTAIPLVRRSEESLGAV